MVDVGCGTGAWLAGFIEAGLKPENVLGLDGDYVDRSLLLIPKERFVPADLSRPQPREESYDLAISLEVAEHLPPSSASNFVRFLTSLSPVVLFSAAIPLQGGTGHVNEQWPAYWAKLFRDCGYAPCDALRRRIWNMKDVEYYYKQNAVFYVRRDVLPKYPKLQQDVLADGELPIAMIHPTLFLLYHDLAKSSVKRVARSALRRMGLSPVAVEPPQFDENQ